MGDAAELARLLREDAIQSLYQPIVDLHPGEVVAYEALARGPESSPLAMPGALFGTAARLGQLEELDAACRSAAVRCARGSGLTGNVSLFVNIEPVAAPTDVSGHLRQLFAGAENPPKVVVELTERALTERPAEVLTAVRDLRAAGFAIALDDVGVDPRSLALMPFLQPDILKLDMSVVQGEATAQMANTMHAVGAHAEAEQTLILAEGIETNEHLERALALGARYGQGWLFGRPAPAPRDNALTAPLPRPVAAHITEDSDGTPFEAIACNSRTRTATKRLLLAMSLELERSAHQLGPAAVVLSSMQSIHHFTECTRRRYVKLANHAAFVAVLGRGVGSTPATGVRGGDLEAGDDLANEWNVAVVGSHFAAAMVARDLGDRGPDLDRRFAYTLTYNRKNVLAAARPMMRRVTPAST